MRKSHAVGTMIVVGCLGCGPEDESIGEARLGVEVPLAIDAFALVGIASNAVIPGYENLQNGQTVDPTSLPPFTVIALSNDAQSVRFGLDGQPNYKLENVAPYSLTGDNNGDYQVAWNPSLGSHTITATAYSADGGGGTAGPSRAVTLNIAEEPEPNTPLAIDAFALVSIATNAFISGYTDLQSGDVLDLDVLPAFTVVAVSDDAQSVRFGLDGQPNYRLENAAPYALTGDNNGDYQIAWSPSAGSHTITAQAFSADNAQGSAGASRVLSVQVVDGVNDFSNDLIALHYDHAPDKDDGHSAAADRTMLESEFSCQFIAQRTVAVSGTYGENASTFNPASDAVMNTVFNPCGGWISAHQNWQGALDQAYVRWSSVLTAGGDVYVKEGGQSDFTADLVRRLHQQLPNINTVARIHVVQHSNWNEAETTDVDLTFVKNNTHYVKISDANAYLNQTGGNNLFEAAALSHPIFGPSWQAAFNYYDPNIRLDFSDTGELMHILGKTLNIDQFRQEYLD